MKASSSLRLALLLAATGLAGCAATAGAVRTNNQANLAVDHALTPPPKANAALGNPGVAHVDTMYFGQTVYRRRRGDDFPPRADHVLVRSPGEVDLHGFASLVTKASGIPVALNIAKATQPSAPAAAVTPPPGLSSFPVGSPGAASILATPPAGAKTSTMSVLWDGPLAALLDLGAARYGVDWEYRDGVIQISDERTETFVVHALPTTSSLDSQLTTTAGETVGGSGSSSAGSGAATQGTSTTGAATLGASQKASLDVWADIKTTLAVIVGDRGRFAVTPSNGTITVTASPAVLTQVASFVREQNAILTRQVFVRVRVYEVEDNNSDDAALSFNAALQNAARGYGLSFLSPGSAPNSAVGTFTATVVNTNSKFNGSSAVAQALSATTKTSLITELNLSALNNRPVSQQSVRSTSYIAQTAVTQGQIGSTTTTQIIPGSLTTGFTVSLLPRIISEDRILMDYSVNLSSLVSLVNQTSGGQTIQLPTTDSDQGMQETELRSGQVLMLSGYISDSAADTRQGTGAPGNFLLGGTRSASTAKKRIIVTMEPVITSGGDS